MDIKKMGVLEYGYVSLNKKGEELCGDKVEIIKDGGYTTIVLADGLGSGVKANILSTLTSKILCTMMAANVSVDECIDTIVSSLPACKTRGVAYSTFSILSLDKNGSGYLTEFDNPPAILLKGGVPTPLQREMRLNNGKKIFTSAITLQENDVLLMFSDGVVHAGVGEELNFGWDIADITEYAKLHYTKQTSAKTFASIMAAACYDLYACRPGDDTTVTVVRMRNQSTANIMIGPPSDKARDAAVVAEFVGSSGKKIVCGGTSSQLVARELNTEVTTSFDYPDKEVPPIGYIDGIDLTCEGVLTLKKLITYAEKFVSTTSPEVKIFKGKDGASLLTNLLFIEATTVNIFVGRGVNLAHEGLNIDNRFKLDLVDKLANYLTDCGKTVDVKYY